MPRTKGDVNSNGRRGKRKRDPTAPFVCDGQIDIDALENEFWQHTMDVAENVDDDFKQQALPLARVKKVMKSDPEVTQMISGETTILFEKACQIFIQELTIRAQMVALENNRRTVQGTDIIGAAGQSNVFDFLINILPIRPANGPMTSASTAGRGDSANAQTGTRSSARRRGRQQADETVDNQEASGSGSDDEPASE